MPLRSRAFALGCGLLLASCDSDSTSPNPGLATATVAIDGRPFRVDSACATFGSDSVLLVTLDQRVSRGTRRHLVVALGSLYLGGHELSDFLQGDGTAWYQDESRMTPDGPIAFRPSLNWPGTLTVTRWDPAAQTIAASFSFLAPQYVPLGVDSTLAIAGRFSLPYGADCS